MPPTLSIHTRRSSLGIIRAHKARTLCLSSHTHRRRGVGCFAVAHVFSYSIYRFCKKKNCGGSVFECVCGCGGVRGRPASLCSHMHTKSYKCNALMGRLALTPVSRMRRVSTTHMCAEREQQQERMTVMRVCVCVSAHVCMRACSPFWGQRAPAKRYQHNVTAVFCMLITRPSDTNGAPVRCRRVCLAKRAYYSKIMSSVVA